ncbi:MAG: hypothetical protein ABEJ91_04075 [Candidatus Nanohaloarchaea archaeon]
MTEILETGEFREPEVFVNEVMEQLKEDGEVEISGSKEYANKAYWRASRYAAKKNLINNVRSPINPDLYRAEMFGGSDFYRLKLTEV